MEIVHAIGRHTSLEIVFVFIPKLVLFLFLVLPIQFVFFFPFFFRFVGRGVGIASGVRVDLHRRGAAIPFVQKYTI